MTPVLRVFAGAVEEARANWLVHEAIELFLQRTGVVERSF